MGWDDRHRYTTLQFLTVTVILAVLLDLIVFFGTLGAIKLWHWIFP